MTWLGCKGKDRLVSMRESERERESCIKVEESCIKEGQKAVRIEEGKWREKRGKVYNEAEDEKYSLKINWNDEENRYTMNKSEERERVGEWGERIEESEKETIYVCESSSSLNKHHLFINISISRRLKTFQNFNQIKLATKLTGSSLCDWFNNYIRKLPSHNNSFSPSLLLTPSFSLPLSPRFHFLFYS